jgi:molybdenum cofactor cytidylyltransferase
VRDAVDLTGFTVVDNVHYTTGCSSSIVAALDVVDERAAGLVLLLGDQPGVHASSVRHLVEAASRNEVPSPLAVCRYEDGRGHPFWFSRATFDALLGLQGDKAVWKLLESGRWPVVEVPVVGPVPPDVDTWDDYRRLVESTA